MGVSLSAKRLNEALLMEDQFDREMIRSDGNFSSPFFEARPRGLFLKVMTGSLWISKSKKSGELFFSECLDRLFRCLHGFSDDRCQVLTPAHRTASRLNPDRAIVSEVAYCLPGLWSQKLDKLKKRPFKIQRSVQGNLYFCQVFRPG
jgi:hypothetical protein